MRTKAAVIALALAAGSALGLTNFPVTVISVMVDTNGVVIYPTNLWTANQVTLNGLMTSNIEERILDIAEGVTDVEIPAALADYYSASQSDTRYLMRDGFVGSAQVSVAGPWTRLYGSTLEQVLQSIDAQIGSGGGTGTVINVTNLYTTIGTTNAAAIGVGFTPVAYTPSAATVQEHLRAVDSRLQYLVTYLTNGIAATTQTLVSVAVTGANTASEGVDEAYTLTALLSDATTTNVSGSIFTTWTVSGAPEASMRTNWLHVPSIVSNATVSVRGLYTYAGVTREATKSVLVVDTNPPVLASVWVSGPTQVNERASAAYAAWAVFEGGASNDVTASATWAANAGAGAAISAGALTAGEVSSNTAGTVTAQYAYDSVICTGTNAVTVRSIDQKLVMTIAYSGAYNVGTLYVDCWTVSNLQNWTYQSWSVPSFSAYGTHTITNTFTTQFQGPTWWYVWLDTDGNQILNGVLTTATTPPQLRIDEPAGITSVRPITCTSNVDVSMTVTLTDFPTDTHIRQGWSASDVGSGPRKKLKVFNVSAGGTLCFESVVLTNRTYYSELDSMNRNSVAGYTNGVYPSGINWRTYGPNYEFAVYGINPAGTDNGTTPIKGRNSSWP